MDQRSEVHAKEGALNGIQELVNLGVAIPKELGVLVMWLPTSQNYGKGKACGTATYDDGGMVFASGHSGTFLIRDASMRDDAGLQPVGRINGQPRGCFSEFLNRSRR